MEFTKDPAALLPFGVDWTDWLAAEGITAPDFAWTASTGITNHLEEVVVLDGRTIAVIWLGGGDAGRLYRCRCTVSDSEGDRTDVRSITVRIRER